MSQFGMNGDPTIEDTSHPDLPRNLSRGAADRRSAGRRLLVGLLLVLQILMSGFIQPVHAASHSVYGLDLREARRKDLFHFFDFRLISLSVTRDGFTGLVFRPPKSSPYHSFVRIYLTLDEEAKIRRMQMTIYRRFIDDDRQGMFARDVAKSFVQAAVPSQDFESVRMLVNEIFFRQKLTEIKVGKVISESSSGSKSTGPITVFKLGTGKLKPGDIIIMSSSNSRMPSLPSKPSQLYQCFVGEVDSACASLSHTILRLKNRQVDGEPVLFLSLTPIRDEELLKERRVNFKQLPLRMPLMI